jgi:hypothetical protein
MAATRYLFFSVAQYVHERREERLNLGVVVFDPERRELVPRFSASDATRRIKYLYPEVDRAGLRLYLEDLGKHLTKDPRIQQALRAGGDPLEVLETEWSNVVRFTPARTYPAVSAAEAANNLVARYVGRVGAEPESARTYGGVERAKRRTVEAIYKVLRPIDGSLNFGAFHGERTMHGWDANELKIPVEFPFWLYQTFVIDAVSLEAGGQVEPMRQADYFIRKVDNLRKIDRHMRPHAVISIDSQRLEYGRSLVDYIRSETGLGGDRVVEADQAEVVVETIRRDAA